MSDQQKITGFLHTVPMFRGLDDKQLQRLAKRFNQRGYSKGEAIVSQGTMGIGLFIVESGRAQAIRHFADGSEMQLNSFGPTEFFGELSLLDEAPRTATVVAVEDTKCLILTQLDFLSALREDSDVSIIMLKEMAHRLRRATESL